MSLEKHSLSSSGVSCNGDNDTSSEVSGPTSDTGSTSSSCLSFDEDSKSSSTRFNIENCADFHVGPKLFAENCQINLNGEPNLIAKVTEKLIGQVDFNSGSKVVNALPPIKSKWRVRKVHLYAIGLTIWLFIVTCVVLAVLREDRILQDSHNSASPNQPFTTWPATDSTSTPRIMSTPTSHQPSTTSQPTRPTEQTTIMPFTTSEPTEQTTIMPFPLTNLVPRNVWHGLKPIESAKRNRTAVSDVMVDNIHSDRCSGQFNCSRILRSLENATQTSLNYNFLIDDSGIIYEARGWYYAADEQIPSSRYFIKFGFIGSYENSHLTEKQEVALSNFITQYPSDFNANPTIKAQCCRDIDTEKGPDLNVACDLYESKLMFKLDKECIVDVKNCDNRSWFWKHITSNTFNCDQTSMLNYVI